VIRRDVCHTVSTVSQHLDIGISTGAYRGLPLAEALLRIRELAAAAEVTSYGSHSLLDLDNARAVAAAEVPFSVHGPFVRVDIGSTSEAKRRAAIELHRRHIKISAMLGATLYLVHPDHQSKVQPRRPAVVAALQRSFSELRAFQDTYGVPIVVENMPYKGLSHFTAPGDIDLCGLALALDVGHAALSGTLSDWLEDSRAALVHIHLHDNQGPETHDVHQPLGTGVVDLDAVLVRARAAGASLVVEHTNGDDVLASLLHLRERGLIK
jgi:sugar phosphate isomerase/epimerase